MKVTSAVATLVMFLSTSALFGQSMGFISREACDIHKEAEELGDLIHDSMHGSIFERRLLNDAAELHRTASRIEEVAERNGNVRQMQADARLLALVLQRMDRTLREAENFSIRHPQHARCGTRVSARAVESQLHHLSQHVANLQRDLEVAGRHCDRQPSWQQPHSFYRGEYESHPNLPRIVTPSSNSLSFQNGRFSIQFGNFAR